ncbi:hypothetical protein SCOCK_30144 [Actinacidiphila cocklensis]|uniref:Uncharacterized protein n=1 Tax=Actinacidiphila cocklensis TaxID=887465 RepID=A0A9W4GRN5_9ACTN|nr:hypothetical protein SCOCK_30144 [Actinacidiphila cocklensis]
MAGHAQPPQRCDELLAEVVAPRQQLAVGGRCEQPFGIGDRAEGAVAGGLDNEVACGEIAPAARPVRQVREEFAMCFLRGVGVERSVDESVEVGRQAGREPDYSLDSVQVRLLQYLPEGQQAPDGLQLDELDRVRVGLGREKRGRAQLGECLAVCGVQLFAGRFCCQPEQRLQHARVDAPFGIPCERECRRPPSPQGQTGSLTLVNGPQFGQPLDLQHVCVPPLPIVLPHPVPSPRDTVEAARRFGWFGRSGRSREPWGPSQSAARRCRPVRDRPAPQTPSP